MSTKAKNLQPAETGSIRVPVRRASAQGLQSDDDWVAVEAPLLVQLAWPGGTKDIAVTMRTPGDDECLALGFLFGEGLLPLNSRLIRVEALASEARGQSVVVELAASPDVEALSMERNFYMTSSCGICGKASLDAVKARIQSPPPEDSLKISAAELGLLPEQLLQGQALFAGTGSIHAAAVFNELGVQSAVFEDVGRHNAVDKLLGDAWRQGTLPLHNRGIMVSGRASFELVQKASMAGCSMLAAVGAPSSLAVELAWETGMTLVGFVRDDRFNVYTNPERVRMT